MTAGKALSRRLTAELIAALAGEQPNVIFGGRLGSCKYYDMDDAIAAALELAEGELG